VAPRKDKECENSQQVGYYRSHGSRPPHPFAAQAISVGLARSSPKNFSDSPFLKMSRFPFRNRTQHWNPSSCSLSPFERARGANHKPHPNAANQNQPLEIDMISA
jgi:hypothetical protein